MPSLVLPDPDRLREHGTPRLVGVPVVLHDDGRFFPEVSAYLRERALFRWRAGEGRGHSVRRPPSENTLVKVGEDLGHFFDWCVALKIDWRTVEWSSVSGSKSLEGYMRAMQSRRLVQRGVKKIGLAASTIERRMFVAVDFLDFAGTKGWRTPLPEVLPVVKVASEPREVEIPQMAKIEAWRAQVPVTYADQRAYQLLIGSILEMGLRREEAALLRDSDIPDPKDVKPGPWQILTIRYGTKGMRTPGDPEKKGKPRKVKVATEWLETLNIYRRTGAPWGRRAALARFREANPGKPAPKELFLKPRDGTPVSREYVRLLWNEVAERPHPGWSPHAGRHFYACRMLAALIERDRRRAKIQGHELLPHLDALGRGALLELSEFLGHVDPKTTDVYLRWVREFLGGAADA